MGRCIPLPAGRQVDHPPGESERALWYNKRMEEDMQGIQCNQITRPDGSVLFIALQEDLLRWVHAVAVHSTPQKDPVPERFAIDTRSPRHSG